MIKIDPKLFLEERIGNLLFKFAAPATLGKLAIAMFAIINTILVGRFISFDGVCYVVPIADFLAFLITALFVYKEVKNLKYLQAKEVTAEEVA